MDSHIMVGKLPYKDNYKLLPFRFERCGDTQVLLTNEVGEFIFLEEQDFDFFVKGNLPAKKTIFKNLESKQFLSSTNASWQIDLLATKWRTRKRFLDDFTSLHMVVPSLGCNSQCIYCQVSSCDPAIRGHTMTTEIADKVVESIFKTRSNAIKIEFQGGEPLLRFDLVRYIIDKALEANAIAQKHLEFVICTNLTTLKPEYLTFFEDHKILISTSLDGPKDIHDRNRPLRDGTSAHDKTVANVQLIQERLGKDRVSALMTITEYNIDRLRDVIDEYVARGFSSIFLRPLNPYGQAKEGGLDSSYSADDFFAAYCDALDYILTINRKGIHFVEEFTEILLHRILTPFGTGFVDLQSPSGCAISAALYNHDGNIYAADEGRMLAEMGNPRFCLGNVLSDSYTDIFKGKLVQDLIKASFIEALPGCSQCVFCPYCGSDPVRNYSEQGDLIGNRFRSETCKRNMAIFKHLFSLIRQNDQEILDIFWAWVTRRSLSEVAISSS